MLTKWYIFYNYLQVLNAAEPRIANCCWQFPRAATSTIEQVPQAKAA